MLLNPRDVNPCPKPSTVLMRQKRSPAVDGLVEGRQHQGACVTSFSDNPVEVVRVGDVLIIN